MKVVFVHHPQVLLPACVASIGNFDGLHRGHQALIEHMQALSQQQQLPSVVISFDPLPHAFFQQQPLCLMSLTEKIQQLQSMDVDYLYLIRFDQAWAACSAADFMQKILKESLGVRRLVVGKDFHFGAKRQGNVQSLLDNAATYGWQVEVMSDVNNQQQRVSSTRLRDCLRQDDFAQAAALLGRPYAVTGRVIHGLKLGRKLGYPTANISLERRNTVLSGVYVVKVRGLGERIYFGAASVGRRPAVHGKTLLLEVYIFDFDHMIYGQRIEVEPLHKLREEKDFNDLEALRLAIGDDVAKAQAYIQERGL